LIPHEWFEQAQQRIGSHIVETPLTMDEGRGLFLKWENHQVTGSFKARGALNKVLSLDEWERRHGLVAASAGNHGQGVALAGQLTGCKVDVFAPAHATVGKVEAMRGLGAAVHLVEGGYMEAEAAGRACSVEQHRPFISPYNDGQVIAGQGTLALEVLRQYAAIRSAPANAGRNIAEIETWIVPTGGAGLISACGAVLHRLRRRPKLIGVQPAASAFAYSLFHRQTQDGVEDNPTLAEGLSGPLEEDSVTIPMLHAFVDDVLTVSEAAIARAIAYSWQTYHQKIEGSAAVGLAAVLEKMVEARASIVIITGGNIDDAVFDSIIAEHAGQKWV
jgi:threonine dehydratase